MAPVHVSVVKPSDAADTVDAEVISVLYVPGGYSLTAQTARGTTLRAYWSGLRLEVGERVGLKISKPWIYS
ncbi:hypothetical protein [Corynebacterium yudongzhengii]|uniref:hypothetical protein n=1 Tax=Corynebacterium yudongzhengii TaxID=2080740 RepID=UPI0011B2582D|nr:hypothetical protein [Corynebacterium yudongzhengii]